MGSINVRVSHDDDFVITQLRRIEIILSNTCAERGNHRHDFRVREHLVVTGLLDVEDLSLDRQNGLRAPVPALLCGTSSRIALHDEYLCMLWVSLLAIRKFAGQGHAIQCAFSPDQLTRSPRSFTRTRSFN